MLTRSVLSLPVLVLVGCGCPALAARPFEIDFPECSVTPRVAGLISVDLTSDELKPYLARAFDPARLPRPLPVQAQ